MREGTTKGVLWNLYTEGGYLQRHPDWHVEESPWKAGQISALLQKNGVVPQTVCEVGCGAGEILRQLQVELDQECSFWGYDISPQAYELSASRANSRLHFKLADIRDEREASFDLLMVIDALEHIDDYLGFLQNIRAKSRYKVFHSSLSISLQTVLRPAALLRHHETYGMVHHFTRETYLQALRDSGYEILDWRYTCSSIELPTHEPLRSLLKLPRRLLYRLNPDFTARTLGGLRLLALAK